MEVEGEEKRPHRKQSLYQSLVRFALFTFSNRWGVWHIDFDLLRDFIFYFFLGREVPNSAVREV